MHSAHSSTHALAFSLRFCSQQEYVHVKTVVWRPKWQFFLKIYNIIQQAVAVHQDAQWRRAVLPQVISIMMPFQLNMRLNEVINMTLLDCYFHYKASACYPDLFFFPLSNTLQRNVWHVRCNFILLLKQNVYEQPGELFEVCPFKRILTSIFLEWANANCLKVT